MTDFAQLGLGRFDANRSTWHKIKAFPQNIELEVAATFTAAGPHVRRRQRHRLPRQHGRHPLRPVSSCPTTATSRASPTTASATSSASSRTSAATTRTPRSCATSTAGGWSGPSRSTRKKPDKLSPPKKKIVFWIEKSVPDEYRAVRPRGHPRMEQGVREDRLPRRHRGAAAGERGLRPGRHQLQHLPLDHHRPRLRDGAVAGQPADRRDPRRRHHLRRQHGPLLASRRPTLLSRGEPRRWSTPASPIQAIQQGCGPARPSPCRAATRAGWNDRPKPRSEAAGSAPRWHGDAGRASASAAARMQVRAGPGGDGAGRRGLTQARRRRCPTS